MKQDRAPISNLNLHSSIRVSGVTAALLIPNQLVRVQILGDVLESLKGEVRSLKDRHRFFLQIVVKIAISSLAFSSEQFKSSWGKDLGFGQNAANSVFHGPGCDGVLVNKPRLAFTCLSFLHVRAD